MQLVKMTCEIRYLESLRLYSAYETIYRDLLKKEPKMLERMPMPGMRIQNKDKGTVMLLDPMRGVIDIEEPPNAGYCKELSLEFFDLVHEKVGIPQIARWGIRSTWIYEFNSSFVELVARCKEYIFNKSSVVEEADDVGVSLDYHYGSQKCSLTAGPMEIDQLKREFLTFEPKRIPAVFLYTDVDIGDTATKKYSMRFLGAFFDRVIKEEQKLSLEIARKVGVAE